MLVIIAVPVATKTCSALAGSMGSSWAFTASMPRFMPRPWSPSPRSRSAWDSMGSAAMMASATCSIMSRTWLGFSSMVGVRLLGALGFQVVVHLITLLR